MMPLLMPLSAIRITDADFFHHVVKPSYALVCLLLNIRLKFITMRKITTLVIALVMAMTSMAGLAATNFQDEVLNYKVMYKWGFISKVAGYATLHLKTSPTVYEAELTARSAKWADKLYALRDTLYTTMSPATLLPDKYVYIAHENGTYKYDVVKFSHVGNQFTGLATRKYRNKKGEWSEDSKTLTATGPSVDLLSMFFYVRGIDFPRMRIGSSVKLNCFSGKKTEVLTVTYNGTQKITVNDKEYLAYCVGFTFTRDGKTSSAPINAWITANSQRLPLQVEGQLPVGKIRCVLAD